MSFQRKMFDVKHLNLICADCNQAIVELPFEPQIDRPVSCRDCARKKRKSHNNRRNYKEN